MKNRILHIIIISLSFISCDQNTAEDYYTQAWDLEHEGKYEEAIEKLNLAIEKSPQLRPALLNRGADKSELGNYQGAIEDFKRIIEFDNDNTVALMNIGNNYKRLNLNDSAIKYYTKAIKTNGAITSGNSKVRLVLVEESEYEVNKYEIEYERGISYSKNKNHELAIIDLNKAIEAKYYLANSYLWIGESYLALSDSLNACISFSKSADLGMVEAEQYNKQICKK